MRLTALLGLFISISSYGGAQNPAGLNVSYFTDYSDTLGIETISRPEPGIQFISGPVVLSREHAVWLKLELRSAIDTGRYCINFFTPADKALFSNFKGGWYKTRNGLSVPHSVRSFFHPNYLSLHIDAQTDVFFVRLDPVMISQQLPPLSLEPAGIVLARYAGGLTMSYVVTGSVLVFFLGSIALFLVLRDRTFIVYSLFLFCFYAMTNKNFLQYLLGDSISWLLDPHINQLFFIANALSFLFFSATYFNLMSTRNSWRRIFLGAMAFSAICMISVFFFNFQTSSFVILIYNLFVVVLVSFYAAQKYFSTRSKGPFYFVLGMSFLTATACVIGLKSFGIIAIDRLDLLADYAILIFSVILLVGVIQRYQETNQQKVQQERETEALKVRTAELNAYNALIRKQKIEIQKQAFELEELNATKDKLLSVLSHDLRGPVGNLNMILSLIGDKNLTAEEFYQISDKLKTDVAGAYSMLEEVLQWVKSQREGINPNPVHFEIDKLLRETVHYYHSIAEAKHITLELGADAGLPVFADRDHISIVLRNILGNAIKFSPESSVVRIYTEHLPEAIRITVTDSGRGMEPEEIQRLLRKERIQGMIGTKGEKGTGLGLFLCMEFLEYNKGNFSLSSEPGKGTSASFTVPTSVWK